MAAKYPWYDILDAEAPLGQGEVILDCPIVRPPQDMKPGASVSAIVEEYDVVILSQACDLENEKLEIVLVCPAHLYDEASKSQSHLRKTDIREDLQLGYLPGYHLLEPCNLSQAKWGHRVVDFRNVFGVPMQFLKGYVANHPPRVCLQPPYREHLSQAFARFFMRVGLPQRVTPLPPVK